MGSSFGVQNPSWFLVQFVNSSLLGLNTEESRCSSMVTIVTKESCFNSMVTIVTTTVNCQRTSRQDSECWPALWTRGWSLCLPLHITKCHTAPRKDAKRCLLETNFNKEPYKNLGHIGTENWRIYTGGVSIKIIPPIIKTIAPIYTSNSKQESYRHCASLKSFPAFGIA